MPAVGPACRRRGGTGDPSMPVDFLTMWVKLKKVNASVIYLTNFYNRVPHPDER